MTHEDEAMRSLERTGKIEIKKLMNALTGAVSAAGLPTAFVCVCVCSRRAGCREAHLVCLHSCCLNPHSQGRSCVSRFKTGN